MTRTFEYDVAIVGGGPAGTSTALHLVRAQGIRADRILIVDKARFPRDKPCAGAISQLGVDAFAEIGVGVKVPFVEMRGVRVLTEGSVGETYCAAGIIIRRTEYDAQLLEEARRDGVAIRENEAVIAIERVPGGFELTTPAASVTARLVAACDGAGSTTRKLLGLREPERKGHLYVLETKPRAGDEALGRGLIDFDLSIVDEGLAGYYWDFPTIIDGALAGAARHRHRVGEAAAVQHAPVRARLDDGVRGRGAGGRGGGHRPDDGRGHRPGDRDGRNRRAPPHARAAHRRHLVRSLCPRGEDLHHRPAHAPERVARPARVRDPRAAGAAPPPQLHVRA